MNEIYKELKLLDKLKLLIHKHKLITKILIVITIIIFLHKEVVIIIILYANKVTIMNL